MVHTLCSFHLQLLHQHWGLLLAPLPIAPKMIGVISCSTLFSPLIGSGWTWLVLSLWLHHMWLQQICWEWWDWKGHLLMWILYYLFFKVWIPAILQENQRDVSIVTKLLRIYIVKVSSRSFQVLPGQSDLPSENLLQLWGLSWPGTRSAGQRVFRSHKSGSHQTLPWTQRTW